MPNFKVEIERETKTEVILTERTTVTVEAEDKDEAKDMVEEMAYADTIKAWSYVGEEEDDADYQCEIISVVESPPEPYRPAPNQMSLSFGDEPVY